MRNFHGLGQGRLVRLAHKGEAFPSPSDVLWIDLDDPTPEKEKSMAALLGLQVPNRQELAEIEGSTRLYQEHGTLVMTAGSSKTVKVGI